ncbi:rCG46117 [Rattus norvegicus]|uniref:RCG46117 n=1 Tax=Rattus norvegicus TaxID=10116 RepID=A6ID45_RAT|nr:rCG46117 [Rattus norvegicus]
MLHLYLNMEVGSLEQMKTSIGESILTTSAVEWVTASILVDEIFGKKPFAEISSVTFLCWRFH